jgi:hypothetical protein
MIPEALYTVSFFSRFDRHIASIPYFAGEVKYNESMAILYLIYNPILKAFKIGVGDLAGNRYSEHRRNGWILVKYWYFKDRAQAFKVERLILQTLKKRFISGFVDKDMMPQGGFTETFDASQTSSIKIIRVVNKAIKISGDLKGAS